MPSPPIEPPPLDAAHAARLLERTVQVLFFAHSYSFYRSMELGFAPRDLMDFVYIHYLHGNGWGQIGVPQGCDEDELPGTRMLHDLLMLGDGTRQVICFAPEQEVDYYAPAFCLKDEPREPRFAP